jgi:hypothetical protein
MSETATTETETHAPTQTKAEARKRTKLAELQGEIERRCALLGEHADNETARSIVAAHVVSQDAETSVPLNLRSWLTYRDMFLQAFANTIVLGGTVAATAFILSKAGKKFEATTTVDGKENEDEIFGNPAPTASIRPHSRAAANN